MSKLCVRNSCGIKNRLKGCNLKCTGFLLLFHLCITFFNFCFLLYVNQSLDRDIFLDYGIAFENNSITINQFKQGKSYKWLLTFSQEFYGENLKKIFRNSGYPVNFTNFTSRVIEIICILKKKYFC